ncbi:MAG: 30S ribosomal protein S27ae [Candidatus Hadarchaeales archaeon]
MGEKKKTSLYSVEGNTVKRTHPGCPRCGPGIFMADHGNRWSCGKCGYTEFKK